MAASAYVWTLICVFNPLAAVKRSSLSFVTVTFKSFSKLGGSIYHRHLASPAPTLHTTTHTLPHTHFSDRLLDKPLTFTLQSLRSISRPFFHVMFTSLWAIWPQWGRLPLVNNLCLQWSFSLVWPKRRGHQSSTALSVLLLIEKSETLGSREHIEVILFLITLVS